MPLTHRSALRIAIAIAAGFLVDCSGSTAPSSSNPEPNTAIVGIQGGNRLVRFDATGQDTLTLLSEAQESYFFLRPQPGGTLIVFDRLSPGGIGVGDPYQVSSRGAGFAPYPGPGTTPVWSPDGSRAAWIAPTYSGTVVVLTQPDLSAPDTIASAEAVGWSPDNTHLLITYRPTNTDQEIGTIDLTTGYQRVDLTNSPANDAYPAWSPDGSQIAFFSDRAAPSPGLYLMNADGTNQRFLLEAAMNSPPIWSPDGSEIAVIDHGAAPRPFSLRIISPGGIEETLPDTLAIATTAFAWSPSGAHALFTRLDAQTVWRTYVASPTLQHLRELKGGAVEAVWIPAP